MKFKYNKQDGIKDCGVCCLHNIIRYYGGNINFEKLRKMVNTDKSGTSIFNLVNVSNKLGLISNAYRCEYSDLLNQKFPVIAYIKVKKVYSHFIIIYQIKKDKIYVFDPIRGYIKYDKELFLEEWGNIILTFKKTSKLVNKVTIDYKYYIYNYIKKNKYTIYTISILSILYTFLSGINSVYIGRLIDNINNQSFIFIYLLLVMFQIIIGYVRNNYIINFNYKFDSKLMSNIFKHIMYLPINYHHSRPVGDIVSRVYDLYYIRDFINELFFSVIVDFLLIIVVISFIFYINRSLFFITLIISIIYFILYYLFRDKINGYLLKNQECQSEANSVMVENLLGIDSIKNLGLENEFFNKQIKSYHLFLDNNKKLNNLLNVYSNISEFIKLLCIIIILYLFTLSSIKIGSLLSIYILLNNLFSSYQKIINIDNLILNSKNAYRRLYDLLSVEEEKQTSQTKKFNNTILFKDFTYSYDNSSNLNNFNLKINKNDYILITGKSGAGKSTLFKALTKQLKINNNTILLDNRKLSQYSNTYIKNKICYVSQNEYIFTDTIKNNILMFKKISKNKLNKILKVCMVDKILEDRNIDLNFLLEENGHNLSGGERQKILLARTLVKESDYIILDETMNEIDIESERKIIKNIKTEYNKTLILISHRLDNSDLFNKCIKI